MYTLKVKNDRGDRLTLTGNPNYTVYKIEGLSPPPATINSSVNTTMDGSTINSTRVENRNIVVYMTIEGDVEENRINLYKYFPVKKAVTLYFTNGTRDVSIEGVVELIECDLFTNKQIAQISLICAKPYFKAASELVTQFSGIVPLFEFPFAIPAAGVEFSTIETGLRKTILNTGDVETGAIITLSATGTVENPVIYNVFTRNRIALNFTMQPSDVIVINTNPGQKSINLIRGGLTTNILGYMTKDSTWLTLQSGDNVFTYSTDSGEANLSVVFSTTLLYSGV